MAWGAHKNRLRSGVCILSRAAMASGSPTMMGWRSLPWRIRVRNLATRIEGSGQRNDGVRHVRRLIWPVQVKGWPSVELRVGLARACRQSEGLGAGLRKSLATIARGQGLG